ncbi:MAG: hypothetical protein IIB74_09195 [Proteobacteria bacterium]|nr:hypothetical protein [Pseudomonadota bacterium]
MHSNAIAEELLVKITTLSAPLGKLVESGYVSYENGNHIINHYKINDILDSLNTKYSNTEKDVKPGLKLKSGVKKKSQVQSVKFQRFIYDEESALKWLTKNKFKSIGRPTMDETELIYTIMKPELFKRFFATKQSKGISLILGFKTKKPVPHPKAKKVAPATQVKRIKSRVVAN